MKLLSFLFAFHILVLSLGWCCADDNCSDRERCVKSEQTEDDHHEHDDSHTGDSIQCTCWTCASFYFPKVSRDQIGEDLVTLRLNHFHNPSFLSGYYHTIWQPPKMS